MTAITSALMFGGAMILGLASPRAADNDALEPGSVFVDCDGCPEMVVLPTGEFTMGRMVAGRPEEGPVVTVKISRRIAVARTETTFDQYALCVEAGACRPPLTDRHWGRGDRPVIYADWADATAFAAWLSRRTGHSYRLPSEAEWEFAARGGQPAPVDVTGSVNCFQCWDGWDHKTEPVARFPANGYGLFDMLGNVTEWTSDCWTPNHGAAPAIQDDMCSLRTRKGGSWYFKSSVATPTYRFGAKPAHKGYDIGFRVVVDLE